MGKINYQNINCVDDAPMINDRGKLLKCQKLNHASNKM